MAIARTWDEVETILVKPLLDGYEAAGKTHKVAEAEADLADQVPVEDQP